MAPTEAWSAEDAGATGSQPLFVDGVIYHLAGDKLWAVLPNGSKQALVAGLNHVTGRSTPQPSTSGLTYEVIDGRPVLFFGTGNNKACAYRIDDKKMRCMALTPATADEEPIVTVPLVLKAPIGGREVDIMIMGDKRGRLWAIQNLALSSTSAEVKAIYKDVGGWVLASPVRVGPSSSLMFIWGNDMQTQGTIGGYQVTPAEGERKLSFTPLWDTIGTIGGVADGFAQDEGFVYASDSRGVFYNVDPIFGTSYDLQYGPTRGPMFANAAPAVDDERVYFAIRNVGTAEPNLNHYPGRLVALNKETFTLEWEANLDAPANTNPLVWTQGPNVVLVGDTKGTIYAFDRKTGAPSPFALDAQCQPMSKLSLGAPEQAGENYQTLTGVSEPILASGNTGQALLIMGVSGAEGGSLKAFRAGGGYNAAWTIPTIPEQSLSLNQPFTHTADLTLTAWNGAPLTDRTLGLAAYWVPTPGAQAAGAQARALPGAVSAEVTMKPGDTVPITVTFTPILEDGAEGQLILIANPRQAAVTDTGVGRTLREAISLTQGVTSESDYRAGNWNSILGALPGHCDGAAGEIHPDGVEAAMADNLLAGAMSIGQMVDLSIAWNAVPSTLACEQEQPRQVSFTIMNPSAQTLKNVPYEAYATDGLGRYVLRQGRATLAPGGNTLAATFHTRSCGTTASLSAAVNLGPEPRPVQEPTFANNTATAAIRIGERVQTGSIGGGDSMVLIVPADCQPNPDPASPYPCTNYPNLKQP